MDEFVQQDNKVFRKFLLKFYLWKCAHQTPGTIRVDVISVEKQLLMEIERRKLARLTTESDYTKMPELDEFDKSDTSHDILEDINKSNIENYILELKKHPNVHAPAVAAPAAPAPPVVAAPQVVAAPPAPAPAPPVVAAPAAPAPAPPAPAPNPEIEIPELYVIYFCIMYLLSISRENKGKKDEIRLVVLALCMAQSKNIRTRNIQIPLTPKQIATSVGFFPPNAVLNSTVKSIFANFKSPQGLKKSHLEAGKRLHIIVNPNSDLNNPRPSERSGEKVYKRIFSKREALPRRVRVRGGAYLKNNIKRRHNKRKNKTIKTNRKMR
jgi:hypothetical protein